AIPLGARVLAVADVYDALCSDRPYRLAWERERARDYIEAHAGTLFDPRVVAAFREALAQRETLGPEAQSSGRAGLPEQEISRHIGRTTSEQWALYEIMQTLNASLSLPERLEVLSRQIAAVRPGTTGAFLLHDPPPGVRPPLS